ncbi:MAG: tRNA (adenosine(37)-N6)-threonylcarbamoyltransferase complex ATPase subunit type 1 TsaE [Acetobacteraceae bacterium]|nr:tRNA (adenosine(37)-N6)-threonylcarbamoyltransferase complex ATPase subunit type 1 TsaE [Acetobacteraceae bacterium]
MIRRERAKTGTVAPLQDLVLGSRRETESLGRALGRLVEGGHVLALMGDLGAGKTTFVRGMMAGLGAPPGSVSSPTFTFLHQYQARLPVNHIDFYRLRSPEEADAIGLSECFNDDTVTAIEWADRFPSLLPRDRFVVRFAHLTPRSRTVRFEAQGPRSRLLLTHIQKAWRPMRRSRSSQSKLYTDNKVRRP